MCVGGRKHRNRIIKAAHFIRYEYAKTLCTLSTYDSRYTDMVKSINAEVTANAFSWNRALQARKAYIMNHPKKVELARKILVARTDKKAITFSATIKQAEKIKMGDTVHSGKTKKKNRLTLEEFKSKKVGVLNASKSLDAGADIPGLNLAVILCNTSSATQKVQRLGRVLRLEEGKEAEIFTLVLKDTQEVHWYNTSTAGKQYIEISESELDSILTGEEVANIEREAEPSDLLFRL